jgi:uncharacterized protein (DUF2062 family)
MLRKFIRLLRYKLIIPILRSHAPPVETARGVLVGLVSAMNPLVGIQMALVAGFWAGQRFLFPNWRFNIIAALAWTWVTNIFTLPIVYYVFLVTGRLMLGRWEQPMGFEKFSTKLNEIIELGGGSLTAVSGITLTMVDLWGVPLFIGCIPWAIFTGWIGYIWTLKFQQNRQKNFRKAVKRQ